MAYSIIDNVKRDKAISKKAFVKVQESVKFISPVVAVKAEESVNFLVLWTAVGWYYFFSGLTMLFRGKLPRGWKPITKKEVSRVISNVEEFTQQRKDARRYGKVVDLDKEIPVINLMR